MALTISLLKKKSNSLCDYCLVLKIYKSVIFKLGGYSTDIHAPKYYIMVTPMHTHTHNTYFRS